MNFDNSYVSRFAGLYSEVDPTPLAQPTLVIANQPLLQRFELPTDAADLAAYFSGQHPLPGAQPIAQKYTGHQFGVYNPALGDGRGLLLGELRDALGSHWDLHLKGAGQTPYSRFGDGRAVLRSCIREFLASEALPALGIPATRALCVVTGAEQALREQPEPCAMLARMTPTHVRFGHFEYLFHSEQHTQLAELADYLITRLHPHLAGLSASERYLSWFNEVVERTAELIAKWQAYGFAHGVMNTDNMSIIGETFDFGPYGFIDHYQADYVPNHSDYEGRYAFQNQPSVGLWNLNRLALALSPLLDAAQLTDSLQRYESALLDHYRTLMQRKLGLSEWNEQGRSLLLDWLQLSGSTQGDYTRMFRALSYPDYAARLTQELGPSEALSQWLKQYRQHALPEPQRSDSMLQHNPKYILRNHLAQQAIEAAEQGDYSPLQQLYQLLQHPYAEQPEYEIYAEKPPAWSRSLVISCSS